MSNPFFINQGPFNILDLLKLLKTETKITENFQINDIKDLVSADISSVTFFHSKKYQDLVKKTRASYCITTNNLKNYLPIKTFFPKFIVLLNSVFSILFTELSNSSSTEFG